VACVVDNDCPGTQICSASNTCQTTSQCSPACTGGELCDDGITPNVCYPAAGECTQDRHCRTDSCDPIITGRCECSGDSDCHDGEVCKLFFTDIGGFPFPLGEFCDPP
jgi:hypothetical protein